MNDGNDGGGTFMIDREPPNRATQIAGANQTKPCCSNSELVAAAFRPLQPCLASWSGA
jgi:hypothetical protein